MGSSDIYVYWCTKVQKYKILSPNVDVASKKIQKYQNTKECTKKGILFSSVA